MMKKHFSCKDENETRKETERRRREQRRDRTRVKRCRKEKQSSYLQSLSDSTGHQKGSDASEHHLEHSEGSSGDVGSMVGITIVV
jgi:hypothetical protein